MDDDTQVRTEIPDLASVPFGDLKDLPAAQKAKVVERVLPGRRIVTVKARGFSSAL